MLKTDVRNFILDNRGNGKRQCFMWSPEGLDQYIDWAFSKEYLGYALNKNSISGVFIAYPLPKPFDGNIELLLPSDADVVPEFEKDLYVADWMATNADSRKQLVKMFKGRFWNWKNQRKLGRHYGETKELSNNYINKLELI